MAGVQETAQWENHVYRIEENDPVHGGENGVTNKPIKHLANRTLYLRRLLTEAGQRINPKKITATSKNSNDLTGHTHEIDHASLTQKGIVQLNASIQSTSTTESATPSAVKAAYDKAATAEQKATLANEKVEAIKVGGRNLLIQSNTPHNGNAYSVRYALAEAPKVGEEIVVTLWGELGSQRTGIGVYNSQGATELAKLVKIRDGVYQGKDIWRKPMSEGRELTPNDTHLNVYFYPKTATDNNRIERIQLERGSIGTDWTPNEADLKAEISAIRTKLIPVRGGNVATTLNAAKRSDWFREMQIPYQSGWGYYTQAFHNSGTQHNYSNLPLTGRYYFIAELYHNSGYSHLRITYPRLKRTFESAINLNNEDLILDWREVVFLKDGVYQGTFKTTSTLESAYRIRAARNDERNQPYLQVVDMGYDLANPPVGKNKIIGSVDYYVKNGTSESSKATMMAAAMPDKNVFWEVALWNAAQQRNVLFKGYSKTNNLSIGKTTDNERDRVQVNGTIQATAPADNANNDQVPTTAWVRKMAKPLYDAAFKIDTANQNKNLNTLLGKNTVWGVAGREANTTKLGNIYNYGVGLTLSAAGANAMLYIPHSRAGQNNGVWVQSSFTGNEAAPVWQRIDGTDWGDIRNNPLSHGNGILHYNGSYLSVVANNGDYAGFEVVRRGNQGNFTVRYEPLPDKRIKWWVQGSHEIFMPAKGGTVALISDIANTVKASVSRSTKSRTINGNSADDNGTAKKMELVGEVVVYPDGKIEQFFHLKQFRDIWFAKEENAVGIANRDYWGRLIPIPLWTAMPNKVLYVDAQLARSSSSTLSPMYTTEAVEHQVAWAVRKQGNNKGQVWIDIGRILGGASEHIDLIVKVEGY
ncbi:phage tail protein [Mannheimia haemolytica]|uniref:phage tail protein n=1 Tax=Mannheimia haemolytica TaxID=75985 RepID=UPI003AFB5EE6